MEHNLQIISVLTALKQQLQRQGDQKYRVTAFSKAIRSIKAYPKQIESRREALAISGVGEGIARRINEIIETGTLSELVHTVVSPFSNVSGVGDVTAKKWEDRGYTSIDDVRTAINRGELTVTHHIAIGLKHYEDLLLRIPRHEIKCVEELLRSTLKLVDTNLVFEICGSYRRELPTSGDIDVLISNPNQDTGIAKYKYLSRLVRQLHEIGFLVDDLTESGEKKYMGVYSAGYKDRTISRRIDIRCFDYISYYAGIIYFTGSKDFNVHIRKIALSKNLSLNEYGLSDTLTGKRVFLSSEEELFDILGIKYIPPHERV